MLLLQFFDYEMQKSIMILNIFLKLLQYNIYLIYIIYIVIINTLSLFKGFPPKAIHVIGPSNGLTENTVCGSPFLNS